MERKALLDALLAGIAVIAVKAVCECVKSVFRFPDIDGIIVN